MKVLLRRDQKSSMMGKVSFTLDVRAELSEPEKASIKKYKLGEMMLYERDKISGGTGLLGVASRFALKMMTVSVSVNDLANGKHIEVKDIVEMLAVEDQIKEAAQTFVFVLKAAQTFGGEEVLDLS